MVQATARLVVARADGARILIVAARYYAEVVDALIVGATRAIADAGAESDVIEIPGAFEAPAAVAIAAQSGAYDGYVALGCVIRGETSHYDYVCGESARGLMDLSIQDGLAIGYGILTVENEAQAIARATASMRSRRQFFASRLASSVSRSCCFSTVVSMIWRNSSVSTSASMAPSSSTGRCPFSTSITAVADDDPAISI